MSTERTLSSLSERIDALQDNQVLQITLNQQQAVFFKAFLNTLELQNNNALQDIHFSIQTKIVEEALDSTQTVSNAPSTPAENSNARSPRRRANSTTNNNNNKSKKKKKTATQAKRKTSHQSSALPTETDKETEDEHRTSLPELIKIEDTIEQDPSQQDTPRTSRKKPSLSRQYVTMDTSKYGRNHKRATRRS